MFRRFHRNHRPAARAAITGAGLALLLVPAARGQATEQHYLTPPTDSVFQYYGSSVDTKGDVLVVGCPEDDTMNTNAGSVWIYRYDAVAADWAVEQQLFASDPQYDAHFGSAVAIDGGVIAVAAEWQTTSLGINAGQAYAFRYDPVTKLWKEEQKLLPSVGATNDVFGRSVDVSGDAILVGDLHIDIAGVNDVGCAFVFRYHDPIVKWTEEAQLIDSNAKMDDEAGRSVSIDGNTAVVSSTLADTGGFLDAGSVSVYTFSGGAWAQTAELTNTSNYTFNDFGDAVAISGNRIVVTATGEDLPPSFGDVGWLHIFERNGSSWNHTKAFANPNPAGSSYFGKSVAIAGDLIVVGHPDNDTAGKTDAGSAWLYRWGPKSGWVFDGQLAASDGDVGDRFAASVAVSSDHIVAGAPKNDTAPGWDWGVAYTFAAAGITLSITPPDPAPGQSITFSAFRGMTGGIVMVTIEDVSGTPLFLPLLVSVFGADNTFTFAAPAPNPAFGLHVGMRAYKISPTGPVIASKLAYVDV